MVISNRIGTKDVNIGTLRFGFRIFMPLLRKTVMPATIPSHPIICGTVSAITNTIEKARVPIDQKSIANLNLISFVLKIEYAKLLKDFFFTIICTRVLS